MGDESDVIGILGCKTFSKDYKDIAIYAFNKSAFVYAPTISSRSFEAQESEISQGVKIRATFL